MAQSVPIRGEAGVGYILQKGFDMPPLMLTSDELDAVVLAHIGSQAEVSQIWPPQPLTFLLRSKW